MNYKRDSPNFTQLQVFFFQNLIHQFSFNFQRIKRNSNSFKGKIPYEKWRDFDSERRVEPHKYFIDGDLIETFLELSSSEASNLIKDFKVSYYI